MLYRHLQIYYNVMPKVIDVIYNYKLVNLHYALSLVKSCNFLQAHWRDSHNTSYYTWFETFNEIIIECVLVQWLNIKQIYDALIKLCCCVFDILLLEFSPQHKPALMRVYTFVMYVKTFILIQESSGIYIISWWSDTLHIWFVVTMTFSLVNM